MPDLPVDLAGPSDAEVHRGLSELIAAALYARCVEWDAAADEASAVRAADIAASIVVGAGLVPRSHLDQALATARVAVGAAGYLTAIADAAWRELGRDPDLIRSNCPAPAAEVIDHLQQVARQQPNYPEHVPAPGQPGSRLVRLAEGAPDEGDQAGVIAGVPAVWRHLLLTLPAPAIENVDEATAVMTAALAAGEAAASRVFAERARRN